MPFSSTALARPANTNSPTSVKATLQSRILYGLPESATRGWARSECPSRRRRQKRYASILERKVFVIKFFIGPSASWNVLSAWLGHYACPDDLLTLISTNNTPMSDSPKPSGFQWAVG